MGKQPQPVLVREWIRRSLYHSSQGYFNVADCVYSPPTPVRFRELQGRGAYVGELKRLYAARAEAWTTPVELFRPWYSRAIGRYILHEWDKALQSGNNSQGCGLKLYEVGGGNGTNACHVLDFLRETAPSIYEQTRYTLVDISSEMSERQRQRCAASHGEKVEIVNKDFLEWDRLEKDPCFVIALEVLDNLPHDKLVKNTSAKATSDSLQPWWVYDPSHVSQWLETTVVNQGGGSEGPFLEETRPLSDPLAQETAELFLCPLPEDDQRQRAGKAAFGETMWERWARASLARRRKRMEESGSSVFVPTGAMQFLKVLQNSFPNHRLIAADFDTLPPPELPWWATYTRQNEPGSLLGCLNSPLVASKDTSTEGKSVDHSTYLVKMGTCDIFFQTDFARLENAYESVTSRQAKTLRSREFLEKHAEYAYTETQSGYNPLLEDYHNTCFLLT